MTARKGNGAPEHSNQRWCLDPCKEESRQQPVETSVQRLVSSVLESAREPLRGTRSEVPDNNFGACFDRARWLGDQHPYGGMIRRFDILLSDFGVLNRSCDDEDQTSDHEEGAAGAATGKRTLPEDEGAAAGAAAGKRAADEA